MQTFNHENYQWQVSEGIATIVNPYRCENMSAYTCYELPEASICEGCRKSSEFEQFAAAHIMHTDAEPGTYEGKEFELLNQYHDGGRGWYNEMEGPAYEGHDYIFENSFESFTSVWAGVYRTRQFLKYIGEKKEKVSIESSHTEPNMECHTCHVEIESYHATTRFTEWQYRLCFEVVIDCPNCSTEHYYYIPVENFTSNRF